MLFWASWIVNTWLLVHKACTGAVMSCRTGTGLTRDGEARGKARLINPLLMSTPYEHTLSPFLSARLSYDTANIALNRRDCMHNCQGMRHSAEATAFRCQHSDQTLSSALRPPPPSGPMNPLKQLMENVKSRSSTRKLSLGFRIRFLQGLTTQLHYRLLPTLAAM